MTYLRLLAVFFRIGALNELQYRANFYVQLLESLLGLATGLTGLAVVFAHTDTLNGWVPAELLIVLGMYFLIGGILRTVVRPSMQRLMEQVRLGTLDYTLLKPEDSQVLVSVSQVEVWKLADIVVGLVTVVVGVLRLGADVGAARAGAFALALPAGAAAVYSILLVLATCSFWFVRVENILVIFQSMYEAGRWPVGIYPQWLRLSLTFLVPVAFATTVPAEALAGRLTGWTLLGALLLAAALLALSRRFWRVGIRRYSGASA
jgi:ABC-2 type transport system permease protein